MTSTSHTLQDQEQQAQIVNRLKRANGQLAAVVRMMEEGQDCQAVVTQMAAVGKAINTAAFTLISASLKECIADGATNEAEIVAKLQKLFLSLA